MEKKLDPCVQCQSREARDAFWVWQANSPVQKAVAAKEESGISLGHLEPLCEASFDGAAIFEKGAIVASNQQFAEMFGYTPAQIKGIHVFALCTREWHGRLTDMIESGRHESSTLMGLRKDGVSFPLDIRFKKCSVDGHNLEMAVCRDMTSRKPNENQLIFQQEEFKAVFESSSDCILVWDKDCNYLYANKAAMDYIKPTPDKVIGKNICEALGHIPEFMNRWKSRIELVFETDKPQRFTDATPVGDKFVYSESVLSPIRHPDGKMFAVGVVYRDVTELKETEMRLRASEERFKRLSETTFEAIVIHRDGKILDANQKFYDMFGYTFEELRHLDGIELIAPQSRDMVKNNIASGYSHFYETLGLKKDGSVFPIEIQAKNIQAYGVTVRMGAIKDLTRHKEMQQQLIDSEKKYRELYDSAAIPLYRTRISDGKLLECNHMLAIMLGYDSKEECLREDYSVKHYADPAQRAQLLARLEQEKIVTKYEIEFLRRNGVHAWMEITARINHEQGYIEGAQIDITASKVLGRIEKEVLSLILQGKSNKEIGHLTHRSIRTIEDHRANIMKKMGVSNLVELVKIGQFMGYHSE